MKITPLNLNFAAAISVISGAQKFVIPVPTAGAEPLVYPADVADKAGQPIVDYKGSPIGDSGVVFFNGKDNAWQAAVAGNGVVIINQVMAEQAAILAGKIGDISTLDVAKLKEVLAFARTELDLVDMYNSDKGFIASKMTPALPGSVLAEAYGHFKRDDRDICRAVQVDGEGEYEGPAATPQKFDDGAIFVQQGKDVRLVQPDVFIQTYLHANGNAIGLDDVPLIELEEPVAA